MAYTYNSHAPTNGVNGFGVTTSEAIHEKGEMHFLNDKLAQYIQKVREMKQAAAKGMDPKTYHEAMKQLESEIMKLKNMYEAELDKLRRALEDAHRQKNLLLAQTQQDRQTIGPLQQKLADEANHAKRAEQEVNNLRRALANAEKAIADLKANLKAREQDSDRLAPEVHKLKAENEDLKRRLGDELKGRHDAEEKLKQVADKNKFDNHVADQTQRDLNDRIKAANDIIQSLEGKLKQLNRMGDNLPAILQKLRDGTAADLRKYQQETEDALNKNMSALKRQMDEDARAREALARDRKALEDQIRALQSTNCDLEGQVKALRGDNATLQSELAKERARAQQAIRDLEERLRALQETIMKHSKEFVDARDAQVSLRAEIETYKSLLNAENDRLKTPLPCESTRSYQPPRGKTPAYGQTGGKSFPDINSARPNSGPGKMKGPQLFYDSYNTTYRHDYTPKHRGKRY